MKIVENNYKKERVIYEKKEVVVKRPIEVECDNCNSKLLIEESDDVYIGCFGATYTVCPCCGEEIMLNDICEEKLTVDNLEFPKHFMRTNKSMRNVKEIGEDETLRQIRECVLRLKENKEEYAVFSSFGDTIVFVFRIDGDEIYDVVVSKDYYETEIPFEKCDYNDENC